MDEYLLRLRRLADYCEFSTLKDDLIRDRVVIGKVLQMKQIEKRKKDCPAKYSKCFRCQKLGHFSNVCRGTQTNAIEEAQDPGYYLREVNSIDKDFWILNDFKELSTTTSQVVIRAFCDIFATHGAPNPVISDNGPQYSLQIFKAFVRVWSFTHVTSSANIKPQRIF